MLCSAAISIYTFSAVTTYMDGRGERGVGFFSVLAFL